MPHKDNAVLAGFFGLKLHIVIKDKGEMLDFVLTPVNVDYRHPFLAASALKDLRKALW